MTDLEATERAAVVATMKTFVGTPYVHHGRQPGVGMDCICSVAEAFERSGVSPHIDVPFYPQDWAMHTDEERLLAHLKDYAAEVHRAPLPADMAVFKVGRAVSHMALVIEYPLVIQAWSWKGSYQVGWASLDKGWLASKHPADGLPRLRGYWSYWDKVRA